ncbi:RNA polymerase sigma factor [Hoeflea sp.]|uniref:RNA polymerase sigma factor n=1 Tax=Hoeflea sp. TaxID=1940281 RepID=UPI003B01210E
MRFLKKRDPTARLAGELKAYALAMTRDPDIADGLVQETLARMLDRKDLPEDGPLAKRHAFRTLHNLYSDNLQHQDVRRERPADHEPAAGEAEAGTFDAVDRLIARNTFELLSPDQREILFLVDVMGFTYDEAGETLGVARDAVMTRVSLARADMIRKLHESPVRPLKRRGKNEQ